MLKRLAVVLIGSIVYATPNYFLCNVVNTNALSCSSPKTAFSQKLKVYSSAKYLPTLSFKRPIFFNIQTQLQHKSPHLLAYADIDSHSNTYAKNIKHLKILSSFALNTISKRYLFDNVFAKFTMGTGVYANLAHTAGEGGLAFYRNSTLSLEGRFHLASSLIINEQHIIEMSLQLPLFIKGIFGYEATRENNVLLSIRFVYGGKGFAKILPSYNEAPQSTPPPQDIVFRPPLAQSLP